jgi:hypothetical protein
MDTVKQMPSGTLKIHIEQADGNNSKDWCLCDAGSEN